MTLEEVLAGYGLVTDDLTAQQLAEIDDAIFCCETCGWWSERSEESEKEPCVCNDCEGM